MVRQETNFRNELAQQAEDLKKTFELTRRMEEDEELRKAEEYDAAQDLEEAEHQKRLEALYEKERENARWYRD